jgi:hypothetical protein
VEARSARDAVPEPRARLGSEDSIDLFSIGNSHDKNRQFAILNSVQVSVPALSQAISLFSGKFLYADRSRILTKGLNALHDALPIRLARYGLEFFERRFLDPDAIACHAV